MLQLGLNENLNLDELLKDNTKYLFRFELDFCYDFVTQINSSTFYKLQDYQENGDEDNFIKLVNNSFSKLDYPERVTKIINIDGYAGGWPFVEAETTKPMTIKEYIDWAEEEINDCIEEDIEDYGLNVVKIYE